LVGKKIFLEGLAMNNTFKSFYQGKTALVTGDTGFKGSWLVIMLLQLGAKIIGYSLPPRTAKDNYVISGLERRITHITGDINDYPKLLETFQQYQPKFVFHLAAQAIVRDSYREPLTTIQTNIIGTAHLLEAARQTPSVKTVVIITSDKCYQNNEWIYGYRENDPLGGKDPYSASKAAAEIIIASYRQSFFIQANTAAIASVRTGNVIGGGDWAPYRIIPDCIRALQNNSAILVRNPEAIRPWQHIVEPLYGYLMLGSILYTEGKQYSGAWNFGPLSKNAIPVKRLVAEIIRQWGSGDYQVASGPNRNSEAEILQLDISKAINQLNWFPVLNFEQTVKWTVDEYRVDRLSAAEVFQQRTAHINDYFQLQQKFGESCLSPVK
jgi:CDP-glucose 4,6-dehydratase